ncbi:MAG: HepT-like ribonuclease domain-containing protein [Methylocystis sp.]|uniref:HepT-like ribonuclease domain-containing protein n=1 Tax=Methylocystis sp. TaxID=1911079 RepID=UPI0039252E1A
MPSSKSPERAAQDILYHIDLAAHFVEGFDYAAFSNDLRTTYAVTRCLEIISEASRRLPDEMKARHPAIPWKRVAGSGNIYRHDYEDVAARYVWETAQRDLPILRAVILSELARDE